MTTCWSWLGSIITDDPRGFLANPLILVEDWSGLSSFGGLLGGLCGAIGWSRLRGDSWRESFGWLDRLAWVFPFAWIFGRLGCVLAHDHRGIFTTSWLAFRYPEGPRYNLGLIELPFTVLLAALFFWLDRRRPRPGTYFGLLGVLYGFFRLWLDTLHAHPPRYFGWTEDQIGAVPAVLIGAAGLLWVYGRCRERSVSPRVTAGAR